MIKYRFKTEEEFIKEFGEDWRRSVCFNTDGDMDSLIGTKLNIDIDKYDKYGNIINFRNLICIDKNDITWYVYENMIIKNSNFINYNEPKKLIYD